MSLRVDIKDIHALKLALKRNPKVVLKQTKLFFVRGIAEYRKIIYRSPWRMGMQGGGAPTDSRNLRDTHRQKYDKFEASIFPDTDAAPYAPYVHGVKGFPRKRSYQLRPWLDHAKKEASNEIDKHARTLLKNVRDDLAR